MSIQDVQLVSKQTARKVVPAPDSYDHRSEDWQETEYRTVEQAEDSLGGIWEGEPGSVSFNSWPYTEFCVLTQGQVAVIDHQGLRRDFHPGDAFVIPKGFQGTWLTVVPSSKYFVAMP